MNKQKFSLAIFALAAVVIFTLVFPSGLLQPQTVKAAVPSDFGLQEGNVIGARSSGDPDVYIVNASGYKRLFLNPVIFNFYGHLTGGFANVKNVSTSVRDAFPTSGLFRDCDVNPITPADRVYGLQVTGEDTGVLHWVNVSGATAVSQDPNFFQKVFCINNNEFNWYPKGADYSSVNQVPAYSRGGTSPTPTPGTNLSAVLASDNPASTSVVANQATADLAHFAVSGSGTVTKVVLKRIGVSADSSLKNVYLYVGNTRVSDAASVSNGTITIVNSSGLFTAPATISVRADLSANTGETLGVQLIQLNDTAVGPISGNTMTVASATLAPVSLAANAAPSGNVNAGTSNYTLWSSVLNVGTRSVLLKYAAFQQIGSITPDAIQNLRLFVDGVQVATGTFGTNNTITFDLTGSPFTLQTGNRTVEVRGDIVSGASRTYSIQLRNAADLVLTDSQFNVNIAATGIPNNGPSVTISSGSVAVNTDPTFNTTTFVPGVTNQTLARFNFKAFGEPVKISQLVVTPTLTGGTTTGLDNVAITVNGGQVASAKSFTGTPLTFDLGSSLTVPANSTVTVGVIADTKAGGTAIDNTSLSIKLSGTTSNAQGVTSGTVSTVPSTTGISAQTLNSSTSSLAFSANPAFGNQTVSPNTQNIKIGSFVIQNSNVEPVRITNVSVNLATNNATTNPITNFSNLRISEGGGTPVNPQTTNNFPVNITLNQNESRTIDVFADAGSVPAGGTIQATLGITANGVNTNNSVGFSGLVGQLITYNTGTLATPTLSTSSPSAQLVVGGQSIPIATYNFAMSGGNGSATITEMHFTVGGTATNPITAITVGGQTATVISGGATVTGLNLTVPSGFGGVDVPVSATFNSVGVGGIASGGTANITLDSVKSTSGNTTATITPSVPSATMTVVASKPSLVLSNSADKLINGQVKLADVTITASPTGPIRIDTIPVTVHSTGVAAVASAADNIIVKTDNGTTIVPSTNPGLAVGASGTGTDVVTLTGGFTIPAGQSKTFSIYTTASSVSGAVGTTSLSTTITPNTSFTWDDIVGNGIGITGSAIFGYPTNTSVITN